MLAWLPKPPDDFRARSRASERLGELAALAACDLDPTQAAALARRTADLVGQLAPTDIEAAGFQRVSVHILAEWTSEHLLAPLIVAGLRRRMIFDLTSGEYGALHQALL